LLFVLATHLLYPTESAQFQIIMMAPNEEVMESVPLAPPENEAEDTQVLSEPQQGDVVSTIVVDPWALPEPDDDPPQEEGEEELSSDTMQALANLKASSMRLGSAISSSASGVDQKLGLTKAMERLDEKTSISSTFTVASDTLGGWIRGIDAKFGVMETAKELSTDFHAHVVEPLKAQPVIQGSTRNIVTFDETHGITRSAASTLAKGADLLAKSLVGDDDGPNPPNDNESDGGFLG
jgi:hypothetical protein